MNSHTTQGGKVSAVNSPARCAEALAHHTFKSSDFLKGSDFAANRSLGFILDALSSNDPEGVDAIDSDLRALVNDVADGMNYIASVLEAPADASQKWIPSPQNNPAGSAQLSDCLPIRSC